MTWMLFIQIGSTVSVIPFATLIPISFPLLAWLKQKVEADDHHRAWRNARLGAEIARILFVYEECGRSSRTLTNHLKERLQEFRNAPPTIILRLLSTHQRLHSPENLVAIKQHQKNWIDGQRNYLSKAMPRRERHVLVLKTLSTSCYCIAVFLALICIGAALAGHQFLKGWTQFLVFTAPAIASIMGIFYADVADTKDIERYRFLGIKYDDAVRQIEAETVTAEKLALFDNLGYAQTLEVMEWWKEKNG